jgi:hypothetical protein
MQFTTIKIRISARVIAMEWQGSPRPKAQSRFDQSLVARAYKQIGVAVTHETQVPRRYSGSVVDFLGKLSHPMEHTRLPLLLSPPVSKYGIYTST